MNRMAIALGACCFVGLAKANDFSLEDWQRQIAYTAVHLADWQQTRRIARNPAWVETNPILGPKPRQVEVNRYFAGTLVGHYLIAQALPVGPRRAFQEGTFTLQVSVVKSNYNLGVGLNF